jgi:hypothetical protein
MAKIPPKTIEQHLDDIYPQIWEEYIFRAENNDWADYDEHPWQWYMEMSTRLSEGWHYVKINPKHKDVTVMYYLRSVDAKFKHSKNEFLIKDEKDAIMVALKYA